MQQPEQQQLSVPLEGVLAAVEEQRNAALTDAAQMRALARQAIAELDQARDELERLRATGAE